MERHTRAEYLVLRRTIAQRGALRPILALCGIGLWALVLIAVLALLPYPVASAIPLLAVARARASCARRARAELAE